MEDKVSFTLKGINIIVKFGLIATVLMLIIFIANIYYPIDSIKFNKIFLFYGITYLSVSIIGFVLLFGLKYMFKGRKEFGKAHDRSVSIAGIFLILSITISLFIAPIIDRIYQESPIMIAFLRSIVFCISSLISIYLIKELAEERIRRILWYLLPIGSILIFLGTWIYNDVFSDFLKSMSIIVIIVPILVIIYCYRKTYIHLKSEKSNI